VAGHRDLIRQSEHLLTPSHSMASETMAETNIKMSESSGAQIGDLINHRMIVTNGETLGNPAVGPTVLEMSCSANNDTEDGTDRQKYESRQKEHKEQLEDGAVVKHRNYEELAERERVRNTEDSQVSSNSTIKFEEQEKIREKDGTSKVAEYNAKCEEKHETTVSTVEKIGDRQFTRRRSISKSFTRTCKRIEDMEDTAALPNGSAHDNTETSESNECSESSGFEKGPTDDVLVKRSEKTTKSERSSTTISGSGDPSVFDKYEELLTSNQKEKGALIDLGALGEIKLSTKVCSGENTLERDFQKADYFNPDLAGLDFTSSSNKEGEKKVEMSNGLLKTENIEGEAKSINTDFVSQVKEHAQERTAAAISISSSRQIYNGTASTSSAHEESKQGTSSSNNISNSSQGVQSASQTSEASETSASSKTRREQGVSMAEQNGHIEVEQEVHVGAAKAAAAAAAGSARDEDDEPRSLPPSFNRRRYYEDSDDEEFEEYEPRSLPPPFAPKNRAETDDLIKRILAEAKAGGSSSDNSSSSRPSNSTAKLNGTAPSDSVPSPSSPLASPVASPISKSASDSISSPLSPSGAKQKIKINMGGEKDFAETSSTVSSASERSTSRLEDENSTKSDYMNKKGESMTQKRESVSQISESMSQKSESMSMQSESMSKKSESMSMQSDSVSSSKAVGAERKRISAEEDDMSLFERRLAKGVEKKLANIFTGDEDGRKSMESDHSRSSYASERSRGAATDHQSNSYSRLEQSSTAASNYSKSSIGYDDQSKLYTRKSGREETDDLQSKYSRKNDWDDQNDVLSKYSRKEKDEFEELDDEINAWRKNFREQQARKQRAYMEEAEESSTALTQYQGGRGRLVRQGYTEAEEYDDNAFALVPRRPPPPEFIPDEDFVPQRRAETTEIVTERTAEIRTVVDKQGMVLEKLRRASSSFDELTNEIKNLKAQVIENSARRSFLMDDEYDDEEDMAVAPPPARAGRFSRYPSGSQSFDFSSYVPGSYTSFRQNRLNDMDREVSSNNITSGESLGLARYKKSSYAEDNDYSSSSFKSTAPTSRFASRGLGRFGRSKSLYDENDADQHSDGDEFEEYKPRARQLPSHDDDQPSYTASVGPGYGSGHGSGDPDLGRSSYRSRFSSADDTATSSSTSSNRLSYTSRFSSGATSGSGGGYKSRLSRANTLSDFDFDRPSSQYDRSSSSSSGFTSRFLQKVRDKKTQPTEEGGTVEETPRKSNKPFKSRFLRASFDSSDFTSKSSSYVSRFKSASNSSSSFAGTADKPSVTSDNSAPNDSGSTADKNEE